MLSWSDVTPVAVVDASVPVDVDVVCVGLLVGIDKRCQKYKKLKGSLSSINAFYEKEIEEIKIFN